MKNHKILYSIIIFIFAQKSTLIRGEHITSNLDPKDFAREFSPTAWAIIDENMQQVSFTGTNYNKVSQAKHLP